MSEKTNNYQEQKNKENQNPCPIIVKKVNKISNKNIVKQSNYLIEASYSLSTQEQRILLTLISLIETDHDDFHYYEIKVKELRRLLGLSENTESMYSELKKLTEKLLSRVVKIKKLDKKELIQTHWLAVAHYKENEGAVGFKIEADLKPYLLQLKSFFTHFPLKNVLRLKGIYSIRLYQILKQYEKIGKRTITIEELRKIFDMDKHEYPLYANFKQKVLKYAQEEIKACTDIEFEMIEGKTSRKVTAITFMIKRKEKELIPGEVIDERAKDQFDKNFELFTRLIKYFEISETQVKNIFKQYSPAFILDNANYVEKKFKEGKLDSLPGSLIYSLQNDLAHTQKTLFQSEEERIKEVNKKIAEQKKLEELKKQHTENLKQDYGWYQSEMMREYLETLTKQEKEKIEEEAVQKTNKKYQELLRIKEGKTFKKDDSLVIFQLINMCGEKVKMLSIGQFLEQHKDKYPYAVIEVKPLA